MSAYPGTAKRRFISATWGWPPPHRTDHARRDWPFRSAPTSTGVSTSRCASRAEWRRGLRRIRAGAHRTAWWIRRWHPACAPVRAAPGHMSRPCTTCRFAHWPRCTRIHASACSRRTVGKSLRKSSSESPAVKCWTSVSSGTRVGEDQRAVKDVGITVVNLFAFHGGFPFIYICQCFFRRDARRIGMSIIRDPFDRAFICLSSMGSDILGRWSFLGLKSYCVWGAPRA